MIGLQNIQCQLPNKQVDITFKNLSYTIKQKNGEKHLLKGIDGLCKSGEVTAILGSSGAGKTTLLNTLSQRVINTGDKKLSGEILANGNKYDQNSFSQFASYVMQDDVLLESLTVKECLTFAANLKTQGSEKEKEQKVIDMIKSLNLERCQNTFIGGQFLKGISGGERKRTSIGYELISDPACIFLDEPTSGLDSFTAYRIIHVLHKYAHEKKKTVVFTIHTPSGDIWNMFDNVMLMVEGKFIYQGQGGLSVVKHFAEIGFQCPLKSNPADYLMSIMHSNKSENISNYPAYYEGYQNRLSTNILTGIANSNTGVLPLKDVKTSFFYQAYLIAERQAKIIKRTPILSKVRLIQSIILGVFLGLVFLRIPGPTENPSQRDVNDKNGILLFFSVTIFLMQLNFCILAFPSQRAVFLREENAKLYTVGPYFCGQFIIDILPAMIFPVITALISYWMIGFNSESAGKVFFFLFVAILSSLTGLGYGYLAGTIFSDVNVAISITPLMVKPFILFAGLLKNGGDYASWIGWLQYFSPFKYAFTALAINEYEYDGMGYPQDPIGLLNFNISKWESVGGLIAVFCISIIGSFICLSQLKKRVQ